MNLHKIKSVFADVLLVAVMLFWIIGIDYLPVLQYLGFPLLILAVALWAKWSDTYRKLDELIDEND